MKDCVDKMQEDSFIPDDVSEDPMSKEAYLELRRIISAACEKRFKKLGEKTITVEELRAMARERGYEQVK